MSGGERGYVLFRCEREEAPAPAGPEVEALIAWRERLRRAGLVGVLPDGVGFGNLSHRLGDGGRFVVSGTATGALPSLGAEHFTEVVECDFAANSLRCRGPVRASSESLSHAAVYRARPEARAVFHGHHAALWAALRGRVPTTDPAAGAGTPEMARSIEARLRAPDGGGGLLVMAGHPDGLISFGPDADAAGARLLEALRELSP